MLVGARSGPRLAIFVKTFLEKFVIINLRKGGEKPFKTTKERLLTMMKDWSTTSDFEKQLHDFRLTTAEIFYHFPDYPELLQTFIWQDLDHAPRFPVLHNFLNFWRKEIDGKVHSVTVSHAELIQPAEFRLCDGVLTIQ